MSGLLVDLRHAIRLLGRRPAFTLVGFTAALALFLAGLGLYGVIGLWVGQRRQEIGLRMALGGDGKGVLRLVLVQAGQPVLLGLAASLGLAVALAAALRSQLFQVTPVDPVSMIVVTAVLLAATGLAATVPAFRAARIEPSAGLRAE